MKAIWDYILLGYYSVESGILLSLPNLEIEIYEIRTILHFESHGIA